MWPLHMMKNKKEVWMWTMKEESASHKQENDERQGGVGRRVEHKQKKKRSFKVFGLPRSFFPLSLYQKTRPILLLSSCIFNVEHNR